MINPVGPSCAARKWTVARKAELRQLVTDGFTVAQLADAYQIGCQTMTRRLQGYGYRTEDISATATERTRLLAVIAGARRDGETWEQVAECLGISRQAAYDFYRRQTGRVVCHRPRVAGRTDAA